MTQLTIQEQNLIAVLVDGVNMINDYININVNINIIQMKKNITDKSNKLYLETDYCKILKQNNSQGDSEFVYTAKKTLNDNIFGEVVKDLVYEYTNSTMKFTSFQYLEDHCKNVERNYDNSLLLVECLQRQYKLLAMKGKTIYCLGLSNIIVIDKKYFIFIGCGGIDDIGAGVIDIVNKNKIYADRNKAIENAGGQIDKLFLAPEFNNNLGDDNLMVHYNTCNYSIGILFLYWFNDLFAFKIQSFTQKINSLSKIHNTKVFYLIRRCIDTDPSLRSFLFV